MATILDNQIGFADESTYGTRVAPTRFLEFVSEGIARNQVFRQSAGLRKGQKVLRTTNQSPANKGAAGPLVMNPALTGFGLILKHVMGSAPVITGAGPKVFTYTLGDGSGLSLTTQIGKPTPAGTVQPHDFLGCKVADATFTQNTDAYLELAMTVDAQQDQTNQALATASYPALQELLHDAQLTVSVNGATFDEESCSFKIDRNLDLNRFFNHSSSLKKEPLWQGLSPITGTIQGEFLDYTTYTLFTAGTAVPIVFTWTGTTGSLVVTLQNCRLEGPKPVTAKAGTLDAPTPFTCLYDGVTEPIQLVYTTTDAAI